MAKKIDSWWDIWLPEGEGEITLEELDAMLTTVTTFDFSFLQDWARQTVTYRNPLFTLIGRNSLEDKLRRTESENLNSKISSGIDLGYRTVEGVIPFIVRESIEENKAYLIDFSKFYNYDKPFRIK